MTARDSLWLVNTVVTDILGTLCNMALVQVANKAWTLGAVGTLGDKELTEAIDYSILFWLVYMALAEVDHCNIGKEMEYFVQVAHKMAWL